MAENENTLTISISCPREESNIDDNVSHTIPFLLGFFVGIVIPVISLVYFSDLAHEISYVNSFMVQKYYKPVIVLLYFIVTTIALLGFYFIHCRYIAETKRIICNDRQHRRDVQSANISHLKDLAKVLCANIGCTGIKKDMAKTITVSTDKVKDGNTSVITISYGDNNIETSSLSSVNQN